MIIISTFALKIIAILAMAIDHVGFVFLPDVYVFRIVGRIAFPIFAFLLVQGYIHTQDDNRRFYKYLTRLFLFAIISEVPFNLLNNETILCPAHQNVFFTLFLSLIALKTFDYLKPHSKLLGTLCVVSIALINIAIQADYAFIGILFVFAFYAYVNKPNKVLLTITIVLINLMMPLVDIACAYANEGVFNFSPLIISIGIVLVLPFIFNYNGSLGKASKYLKYFFYIFYPLHMMIIYGISLLTIK